MTSYIVNIPDDKKSFFEELLSSLGFESKKENEDFIVPDWHKKIVLDRIKSAKPEDYKELNWKELEKEILFE